MGDGEAARAREALAATAGRYGLSTVAALTVALFVVFLVHELVHGLAYLTLGSLPPSDIEVGVAPYGMGIYVRPTVPLDAHAYRHGLALPGVVAGVFPAVGDIVTGDALLALAGTCGVLITSHDVATLVELRPSNTGDTIPPPRERS